MGVLLSHTDDGELYREAYEEAQRIIRVSDEIRMSLERVSGEAKEAERNTLADSAGDVSKLTTSKLAKKLRLGTKELLEKLTAIGFLQLKEDKHYLSENGKAADGEFRMSKKFGPYFLWAESTQV